MTEYCPFIDDPAHLAALDKERYVVLRPHGDVASEYARLRDIVRTHCADLAVSHPAQGHVMLKGFPAGARLEGVHELVRVWARDVPPLQIETERVTVFPPPFKVVVLQVHRTAALVHALSSLRQHAAASTLPDFPPDWIPSLDDWIFHMSLAYGGALDDAAWEALTALAVSLSVTRASCVVNHVEIAAFDGGREYAGGSALLSGPTRG